MKLNKSHATNLREFFTKLGVPSYIIFPDDGFKKLWDIVTSM